MKDLARAIRKAEKALGSPLELVLDPATGSTIGVQAVDAFEDRHTVYLGPPSFHIRAVEQLHEAIYRSRGRKAFKDQKGLCAICGKPMRGTENTEVDHIKSRGAHGRDDRQENLQVVHGNPCHHDKHSKRKK